MVLSITNSWPSTVWNGIAKSQISHRGFGEWNSFKGKEVRLQDSCRQLNSLELTASCRNNWSLLPESHNEEGWDENQLQHFPLAKNNWREALARKRFYTMRSLSDIFNRKLMTIVVYLINFKLRSSNLWKPINFLSFINSRLLRCYYLYNSLK